MAYLDRSSRNWGALAATVFAVPIMLVWAVIEIVGGALACDGVDGPCAPSILGLLGGMVVIAAIAIGLGWLVNRIVGWATNDR